MDLDAILARKPQIAVVDELAHTNVPGSRNRKRYQDVLELLDAGHQRHRRASTSSTSSASTTSSSGPPGVAIRETVPDSFLKEADQVVNLDLAVEDLHERLRAGKIYARGQGALGARALLQGREPVHAARAGAARGGRERWSGPAQAQAGRAGTPSAAARRAHG